MTITNDPFAGWPMFPAPGLDATLEGVMDDDPGVFPEWPTLFNGEGAALDDLDNETEEDHQDNEGQGVNNPIQGVVIHIPLNGPPLAAHPTVLDPSNLGV